MDPTDLLRAILAGFRAATRLRVTICDPNHPQREVVVELPLGGPDPGPQTPPADAPLSEAEDSVLQALTAEPQPIQRVARQSGYAVSYCRRVLPQLVRRGLVTHTHAGYARTPAECARTS